MLKNLARSPDHFGPFELLSYNLYQSYNNNLYMRMIGKLAGKKSIHLTSSDEQQSMTRLISGPAEAGFRHFIFVFMSYVLHCFTINQSF